MNIELIGSWASIIALALAIAGFFLRVIIKWRNLIRQQHENESSLAEYLSALVDVSTSASERNDLSTFLILWVEKYKRYNYQILFEFLILTALCFLFFFYAYIYVFPNIGENSNLKYVVVITCMLILGLAYLNHFLFLLRVYQYRISIEQKILTAWERQVLKRFKGKYDLKYISGHKMPIF